jgi:spore germination cell wall hydrolase CwlJ-like protein
MKRPLMATLIVLSCALSAGCTVAGISVGITPQEARDANVVAQGVIGADGTVEPVVPTPAPRPQANPQSVTQSMSLAVSSAFARLTDEPVGAAPAPAEPSLMALDGAAMDARPAAPALAATEALAAARPPETVQLAALTPDEMRPVPGVSATDAAPAVYPVARPDIGQAAPRTGKAMTANARERDCLTRAMYFESRRNSPEGLLAVGTVVMNRVDAGLWGDTICGVVGAKRQFAPGVLTRKMQGDLTDLQRLADDIMAGKRHPKITPKVMFFHVATRKFPYRNMRYVHVAGGNSFYYKAGRG